MNKYEKALLPQLTPSNRAALKALQEVALQKKANVERIKALRLEIMALYEAGAQSESEANHELIAKKYQEITDIQRYL